LDLSDDDDHGAIQVWEIGRSNKSRFNHKKSLKTGFQTVLDGDELWRVYVTNDKNTKKRYAVAQEFSVSAEIALNSAKNTALPLLLLFLLVPLLVTLVVRHSFKPLNVLASKVEKEDSLKLDLSAKKEIPVEVLPFVTAIDSLLEKNEAYNQRQRRFIADAAHELRTPITALSLEIENVQTASSESIKTQRQAGLKDSALRLQRLVNQLLDLARVQSLDKDNRSTVHLNDIVKTQIADLYVLADDKNIEMSVERNEPVDIIDVNNQIQHLIRNALSNAIKFTPEGGTIAIDVYCENENATFCVLDDGPGVEPEQLAQLHEPFYRPDGQVSGKGAGLGLAICHEIANHLQGQLTLENISPTGFKFCYRQAIASL
jgi:signal transduction histidine kinase